MEDAAVGIGLTGVAGVVLAYALVSSGKWRSDEPRYQWLNMVGTAGILFSLLYQWNFPSFVTQCIWILLSIVGLVRIYRKRRSAP